MVLGDAVGGTAMSIWTAARYGFTPLYWLTIEGIPVVWTEKATGKTLPTGYTTEDASLAIDKSGAIGVEQIDRQAGKPSSPPFSFELLDSTVTRDWMRKPSVITTLTASATATDLALSVASSSGFSTEAYLGLERVTVSGTAAGVINLAARGVNGYPYAHSVGSSSQIVSDRPRYWRGRQVTLWASPMDAAGYVTGTSLAADAREIWRGRINAGPVRNQAGFSFEAESLDRILDGSLAANITGQIAKVGGMFVVDLAQSASVYLYAQNNGGATIFQYAFELQPFAGTTYAQGDIITGATARSLVTSAFNNALVVVGAAASVLGMKWVKLPTGGHQCRILFATAANVVVCEAHIAFATVSYSGKLYSLQNASNEMTTDWACEDSPLAPSTQGASLTALSIKADDAKTTSIPSEGWVFVNGSTSPYTYQSGTFVDGLFCVACYLSAYDIATCTGKTAEIRTSSSGGIRDLMASTIESSGTTGLRGLADTLPRGSGYALSSTLINFLSFSQRLSFFDGYEATAAPDGGTFWDMYSGFLGFYRLAIVSRWAAAGVSFSGTGVALCAVSTAPASAPQGITITDSDLLAHQGDPIESATRIDAPNSITLKLPFGDQDNEDTIIFNDVPNIEAQGRRDAEYKIAVANRAEMREEATHVAAGAFAFDQSAQAATLLVPPWVEADVGDIVQLDNLTHPALWTWGASPGKVGYSGLGRVVGRTLELRNLRVKLTVLFDGGVQFKAISPAAQVSAFTGPAGNVTSMTVPLVYLAHFQACRAATGGNYYVQHYIPGEVETTTQWHRVTAESAVGGNCVLTTDTHTGGHNVIANASRLTLPTSTGGRLVSFQSYFAHVDDGGNWG